MFLHAVSLFNFFKSLWFLLFDALLTSVKLFAGVFCIRIFVTLVLFAIFYITNRQNVSSCLMYLCVLPAIECITLSSLLSFCALWVIYIKPSPPGPSLHIQDLKVMGFITPF